MSLVEEQVKKMTLKLLTSSDTKNRSHPWRPLIRILSALHKMGGFPFQILEKDKYDAESTQDVDSVTFEPNVSALLTHAAKIIFNITLQVRE